MVIWYSLWSFGIFFPIWHVSPTKNLATLLKTIPAQVRSYKIGDGHQKKLAAKKLSGAIEGSYFHSSTFPDDAKKCFVKSFIESAQSISLAKCLI
jgi:hypothetical protein